MITVCGCPRLKIRVSVVRLRPWAPFFSNNINDLLRSRQFCNRSRYIQEAHRKHLILFGLLSNVATLLNSGEGELDSQTLAFHTLAFPQYSR